MSQRIAQQTLYLNADRTKVVKEDDPDAAYLLVSQGTPVDESVVKQLEKRGLKVSLSTKESAVYDAKADHEANHAGESETEAKAKRSAMLNKARKAPPEDK